MRRTEMGKSRRKPAVDEVPLTQRLVIEEKVKEGPEKGMLLTGRIDNVDPFLANWYGLLGYPISHYVEGGVYVPDEDHSRPGHLRYKLQPDSRQITLWRRDETTGDWNGFHESLKPHSPLSLGSAKNRVFFSRSQLAASDRPLEISGFPELPYEGLFLMLPINKCRCPLYTANEAGVVQLGHRLMVMAEFMRNVTKEDREPGNDQKGNPAGRFYRELGYEQWVRVSVAVDTPRDDRLIEGLVQTRVVPQRPDDSFFLRERTAKLYFR